MLAEAPAQDAGCCEDGVLACAAGFVSLDTCSVLLTVQTNHVSPGTPLGSEAAPRPHRTAGVLGVPLGSWETSPNRAYAQHRGCGGGPGSRSRARAVVLGGV